MRWWAAAVGMLLIAGCTTGPSLETRGRVTAPPGDRPHLTVGSAGFTESDLLAHMYATLLNHAGYRTSVLTVANRELYEPALESGQIDVVPEYAATFADWLNTRTMGRTPRPSVRRTSPPPCGPCGNWPLRADSPCSTPAARSPRTPSR